MFLFSHRNGQGVRVTPVPTIFEKLSCIIFHKMKLVLCKARLYKLTSVLSDVKLMNQKNLEIILQNSQKIQKNLEEIPKKSY